MGLKLWNGCRVATMQAEAPQPYGLVEDAALVVDGSRVHWVGPESELPADVRGRCSETHDAQGALITPGLIDCHTHLVYGGDRAMEFELRLDGATYEEIARRGGGIASTVQATRHATPEELMRAKRGAAAGAAGRRRDDAGDQVRLRAGAGARAQGAAGGAGAGPGQSGRRAHHLPGRPRLAAGIRRGAGRLHRRGAAHAAASCMAKDWWMRWTRSASGSPSARRRWSACSRQRGSWACRSSCMPSN